MSNLQRADGNEIQGNLNINQYESIPIEIKKTIVSLADQLTMQIERLTEKDQEIAKRDKQIKHLVKKLGKHQAELSEMLLIFLYFSQLF